MKIINYIILIVIFSYICHTEDFDSITQINSNFYIDTTVNMIEQKDTTISTKDNKTNFNTEIGYFEHFYAYPPYPTPSRSFVKVLVFWDNSFELKDAIFGIFDCNGIKISFIEQIAIEYQSAYLATLSLDCSLLANGVYFIIIKQNGRLDPIPIIIEK